MFRGITVYLAVCLISRAISFPTNPMFNDDTKIDVNVTESTTSEPLPEPISFSDGAPSNYLPKEFFEEFEYWEAIFKQSNNTVKTPLYTEINHGSSKQAIPAPVEENVYGSVEGINNTPKHLNNSPSTIMPDTTTKMGIHSEFDEEELKMLIEIFKEEKNPIQTLAGIEENHRTQKNIAIPTPVDEKLNASMEDVINTSKQSNSPSTIMPDTLTKMASIPLPVEVNEKLYTSVEGFINTSKQSNSSSTIIPDRSTKMRSRSTEYARKAVHRAQTRKENSLKELESRKILETTSAKMITAPVEEVEEKIYTSVEDIINTPNHWNSSSN